MLLCQLCADLHVFTCTATYYVCVAVPMGPFDWMPVCTPHYKALVDGKYQNLPTLKRGAAYQLVKVTRKRRTK